MSKCNESVQVPERAVALLLDPPDWLLDVMNQHFPTQFEIEGDDNYPFKQMIREVALAALNPPQ